ncbi:MAG: hypothetical protein NTY93_00280 [Candidatus Kaiserbacteria bacterium]|nr:hypothetical protein [Candidatus Kaiserbacteria bacterium]
MDNEPFLPPGETLPPMPSPQAQSWGVIISIIIIVMMIVVGAFYSWGQRISQEQAPVEPTASSTAQ